MWDSRETVRPEELRKFILKKIIKGFFAKINEDVDDDSDKGNLIG